MKFLLPQGIGDSIWALTKVQDIAKKLGDEFIEIVINTMRVDVRESRSIPFLQRFDFISSLEQMKINILVSDNPPTDENGYFKYIPSGQHLVSGIDYVLMPNAPMERGIRLEKWLPEFETNWDVMNHFRTTLDERRIAALFLKTTGPFCVFFMGSELANTEDGHNRGSIWKPEDWAELGRLIKEQGVLQIVVVGASYDRSYWTNCVEPLVRDQGWIDLIGRWEIPQVFEIIGKANYVVSFQAGIGIVAEFIGIPAAMFWRAKGDSISSTFYASFEESMNGCWSPPNMIDNGFHLPLIYGRHDPAYVAEEIRRRNW